VQSGDGEPFARPRDRSSGAIMPVTSRHRPLLVAIVLIPTGLLLALAVEWTIERGRPHETPLWNDRSFTALRTAPGAPAGWEERWVVAVHPGCPHCRVSLASLAAARDRSGAAVEITALIVDAAAPPSQSMLARLPADETRWDERSRWRRGWGHGVYGEVLCFDPGGALRRVLPPFLDVGDAEQRITALGLAAFTE
jgi:hypothetical protein